MTTKLSRRSLIGGGTIALVPAFSQPNTQSADAALDSVLEAGVKIWNAADFSPRGTHELARWFSDMAMVSAMKFEGASLNQRIGDIRAVYLSGRKILPPEEFASMATERLVKLGANIYYRQVLESVTLPHQGRGLLAYEHHGSLSSVYLALAKITDEHALGYMASEELGPIREAICPQNQTLYGQYEQLQAGVNLVGSIEGLLGVAGCLFCAASAAALAITSAYIDILKARLRNSCPGG